MKLDLLDLPLGTALLAHVLYGIPGLWSAVAGIRPVTLHNGDDFSNLDEPPHPDRLRHPRLVTGGGVTPAALGQSADGGIAAHLHDVMGPAWFVVETAPAFIELEADEFDSYLAHEGLTRVREARLAAGAGRLPGREIYSKAAKVALDARRGFVGGPIGLPIEIVPENCGPLLVGTDLSLRVEVGGFGAAGLQLQVTHRESRESPSRVASTQITGGDGVAVVRIDAPGFWRLHTIAMDPHPYPADADWRSHWASLTFHV